jgi:competence protein ComEC
LHLRKILAESIVKVPFFLPSLLLLSVLLLQNFNLPVVYVLPLIFVIGFIYGRQGAILFAGILVVIFANVLFFNRANTDSKVISEQMQQSGRYRGIVVLADSTAGQFKAEMMNLPGHYLMFKSSDAGRLQLGHRYRVDCKIWPPFKPMHHLAFDYDKYLRGRRVIARGELKSWEKLPGNTFFIAGWFKEQIQKLSDARTRDFALAMLAGNKRELSATTRESFARAGMMHLLAVSGFHIGVVFASIFYLLGLIGVNRNRGLILAAGFVWIYILAVGVPVSALRAGIMLTIGAVGKTLGRKAFSWANYWLSFFTILIINSNQISDPGFVLSFTALGGILLFLPVVNQMKYWLQGQRLSFIAYPLNLLLLSFGAQLGTAIPANVWFGEQNALAPFLNIIAIPLASITIPVLWLDLMTTSIFNVSLSFVSNLLIDAILWLSYEGADTYVGFSFAAWPVYVAFIFYAIIFRLLAMFRWPFIILAKSLLAVAILLVLSEPFNGNTNLCQMNVGQGDATFVATPDADILIDAGNRNRYFAKALHPLIADDRLEKYVITHPDQDHYGGLSGELTFAIDSILVSPYEGSRLYREMLDDFRKKRSSVSVPDIGILHKSKFSRLYCLHNGWLGHKLEMDKNNGSIILLFVTPGYKYLLMGDAEKPLEKHLHVWHKIVSGAILKFGHHGSRKAGGVEFLQMVQPPLAILSCGKNNRYGHPHDDVLARLSANRIRLHRTDIQGYWLAPKLELSVWD